MILLEYISQTSLINLFIPRQSLGNYLQKQFSTEQSMKRKPYGAENQMSDEIFHFAFQQVGNVLSKITKSQYPRDCFISHEWMLSAVGASTSPAALQTYYVLDWRSVSSPVLGSSGRRQVG